MADLGKIVYLSEAQKDTLFANGTITANGQTVAYSDNDLYITPHEEVAYENKTAVENGTDESLVTTGEKYIWNNKGTYSKPSSGIPASDLAADVIPSVPSAYTSTPKALGTASAGSSATWARGDHVHPLPSLSTLGAASATKVVTQASIDANGLISYKNSSGTTQFTLQLPLYTPATIS